MNVAKKMAIRLGVYALLIGYMVCDLFVFQGPIYRSLNEPMLDTDSAIAEAKAQGVAARVYYRPIYRSQVEEALKEYLWRRGRKLDDTSATERKTLRKIIVEQLIDDELLKLQIKVSTSEEVAVADEKVEAAIAVENQRHPDPAVREELMKKALWRGEKEREFRIAARLQREAYLVKMMPVPVSDDEALKWFEARQDQFANATFEQIKDPIKDALAVSKKEIAWKTFRRNKLRHRAQGKIDLFEDVLFAEEVE